MYIHTICILVEVINASSLQEQTIRIEGTRGTEQQELVYKITLFCLSPCILFLSLYLPLLRNIISRQVAFLLYLMLSLGRWYLFTLNTRLIWQHFVPSDRESAKITLFVLERDAVESNLCLEVNIPLLHSFLFLRPSSFRSPKRVPPGNSATSTVRFFRQSSTTYIDDTLTTHNTSTQLLNLFL